MSAPSTSESPGGMGADEERQSARFAAPPPANDGAGEPSRPGGYTWRIDQIFDEMARGEWLGDLLPTRYPSLCRYLSRDSDHGGLRSGQVVSVIGEPGGRKTSFAATMAWDVGGDGRPAVFCQFDEGADLIASRVAQLCGLSERELWRATAKGERNRQWDEARAEVKRKAMFLDVLARPSSLQQVVVAYWDLCRLAGGRAGAILVDDVQKMAAMCYPDMEERIGINKLLDEALSIAHEPGGPMILFTSKSKQSGYEGGRPGRSPRAIASGGGSQNVAYDPDTVLLMKLLEDGVIEVEIAKARKRRRDMPNRFWLEQDEKTSELKEVPQPAKTVKAAKVKSAASKLPGRVRTDLFNALTVLASHPGGLSGGDWEKQLGGRKWATVIGPAKRLGLVSEQKEGRTKRLVPVANWTGLLSQLDDQAIGRALEKAAQELASNAPVPDDQPDDTTEHHGENSVASVVCGVDAERDTTEHHGGPSVASVVSPADNTADTTDGFPFRGTSEGSVMSTATSSLEQQEQAAATTSPDQSRRAKEQDVDAEASHVPGIPAEALEGVF